MVTISYIITILLGLAVGSFLNCLAWRLYTDKTIKGRSMCPKCEHDLAWHDNIPLLSFIILGAKCRHCGKGISWQYPLVEFFTAVFFVLAFYYSPWSSEVQFGLQALPTLLKLLRDWVLIAYMMVIFIMDFNWYIIVDKVSLPACVIMLTFSLLLGFSWQNLAVAGIIGAGFFLTQFLVSKGKWIGGGDVRLGLLMGLALGWPQVLAAIMLAYLLGAVIGIAMIALGKKSMQSKIPFGTFLSVATIICLFWGQQLLDWYLNLLF